MEPTRVVDQSPCNVVFHRLIDCVEIGENGLNPGSNEVLLGSHSHATGNEYSHACKRSGHCRVFMIVVMARFSRCFRPE